MGLTKTQQLVIRKARAAGGGNLGVGLSDQACCFLVATIAKDLGICREFPELPQEIPPFFVNAHPADLVIANVEFYPLIDHLVRLVDDADTYFACLASLHRARLKYSRILAYQPIPTMDQVGPRALLQFGSMSPRSLAGFILWRKWLFDIDNRAGQETGYLFEPIIANSIGGVPYSAKRSPIRRRDDPTKSRQVDCLLDDRAYEIKIRVTIAASGQGRWGEELAFPVDCRESGYQPMLVVLDPTPNPKLDDLRAAFLAQGGEVYVGNEAWTHLEALAGHTMSIFLERYVREPIQEILNAAPVELPRISFQMSETEFSVAVEEERYAFTRSPLPDEFAENSQQLPDDIDEETSAP